jgi:hypothetical protein
VARLGSTGVTVGLTALLLSACSTTQQEATRLQLNSSRLRAAERRVTVTRTNPTIRVERVTLLNGGAGSRSAIAVKVRNLAASATSDLPVAVRVQTATGRTVTLNGAAGLDYFETHLPSITPHGELTWVFTTDRRLPPGAHVLAAVGTPSSSALHVPDTLPSLQVTPSFGRPGTLRLTVHNPTSVPQYQLQVYALIGARGRIVAAGRAAITHLGTHTSTTLTLRLLGGAARAGIVSAQAPPTIFR